MKQYIDLMKKVLDEGEESEDRTGTGTIALFGEMLKFDLRDGFPAVTTKKLAWKSMVSELIWFLRGSANVNELRAILHGEENRNNLEKKTIWDDNYNKQAVDLGYYDGYMGSIYGTQWMNFGAGSIDFYDSEYGCETHDIQGINQVKCIIDEAKVNPSSRRLIVSAWNPMVVWDKPEDCYDIDTAALPPCHMLFQLNIINDNIDLMFNMRSNDLFLGNPFNDASYALLLCIFARILDKNPRHLVASLGNVHVYKNHIDQCREQITRIPKQLPGIWINPNLKTLEDFANSTVDDYKLIEYEHHPSLTGQMAV